VLNATRHESGPKGFAPGIALPSASAYE
jgi:hypothetical protein